MAQRPMAEISAVRRLRQALRPVAAPPDSRDRWLALICAAFAMTSAVLARSHDHFLPTMQDEHAYLFQAKTLLQGRLFLPSPTLPEFFEAPHVLVVPRYFAKYPPGNALALAPFVALGVPWLWPCAAFGATAAVLFLYLRRARTSRTAALLGAALLALSPLDLMFGPTLLSHATSALLAVVTLAELSRREPRPLLVGALVGATLHARQLTAVALGVVALVALLVAARQLRPLVRALLLLGAPIAVSVALALAYNFAAVGSPLFSPWQLWARQYTPFDGPGIGPPPALPAERAVPPHLQDVADLYRGSRTSHLWPRLPDIAGRRLDQLAEFLPQRSLLALALLGVAAALFTGAAWLALLFGAALFTAQLGFHSGLLQHEVDKYPALCALAAGGLDLALALYSAARARALQRPALGAAAILGGALLLAYPALFGVAAWPAAIIFLGLAAAAACLVLRAAEGVAAAALVAIFVAAEGGALGRALASTPWKSAGRGCTDATAGPGLDAAARGEDCQTERLAAFDSLCRRLAPERAVLFVRFPHAHRIDYPIVNPGLGTAGEGSLLLAVDRGAEEDRRLLDERRGRPGYVLDAATWQLTRLEPSR